MVTLESLPRELRQHIFKLAFDHAIYEDHKLNDNIRTCIRRFDGVYQVERGFLASAINIMEEVLGPGAAWCTWRMSRVTRSVLAPKIHAPHIYNLASALLTVYPDTADDMSFVLENSVTKFEEDQQKTLKQCEEEDAVDWDDAILLYSDRARDRKHNYDTWYETCVLEQDKIRGWQHAGRSQRRRR